MVVQRRRLVREVIGIDPDAVTADEAGGEGMEVPLGAGRREHVAGVDVHPVEDQGQLVHQCDVEIALRVLDHLRRFRHPDPGDAVNPGGDHGFVDAGDDVQGRRVLPGHDLRDAGKGVLPVAGVDALRRVPDREVRPARESRRLFEHRDAVLLRRSGIDRGFEHHDVARLEPPPHGTRRTEKRAQIRAVGLVHRGRHRDDVEVRLAQRLRVVREADVGRVEVGRHGLTVAVHAPAQLLHPGGVYVVADDPRPGAERECDRQPGVSDPDDRDPPPIRHRRQPTS